MQAQVDLQFSGDDPDQIKKNPQRDRETFPLRTGPSRGVDLAGMVRNAKAAFGLAEKGGERPRTDFSELTVPFTLTNGLFRTDKASIASPLLRVLAAGDGRPGE